MPGGDLNSEVRGLGCRGYSAPAGEPAARPRGCRQVQRPLGGGSGQPCREWTMGSHSPGPPQGRQALRLAGAWRLAGTCGQRLHRGADGVSSKLKIGESSKMELTHPKVAASSAGTLRRCVKHIAEGGRSERDLRNERGGPFDPGDCPGAGRVPQHGAAVPEVPGGHVAQAAAAAGVEAGPLRRAIDRRLLVAGPLLRRGVLGVRQLLVGPFRQRPVLRPWRAASGRRAADPPGRSRVPSTTVALTLTRCFRPQI